jgi:hypothetical protein
MASQQLSNSKAIINWWLDFIHEIDKEITHIDYLPTTCGTLVDFQVLVTDDPTPKAITEAIYSLKQLGSKLDSRIRAGNLLYFIEGLCILSQSFYEQLST